MQSRNGRPSPPGDRAGGGAMRAQPSDRELTSENPPEPPGTGDDGAAADDIQVVLPAGPASFRRTGPGRPNRPARPRPSRTSCPGGTLTPPGRRCRPGFPGSPRGPVRRMSPACRSRTSGPCRRSSSTRSGGRSGPARRARPSLHRSPARRSPARRSPPTGPAAGGRTILGGRARHHGAAVAAAPAQLDAAVPPGPGALAGPDRGRAGGGGPAGRRGHGDAVRAGPPERRAARRAAKAVAAAAAVRQRAAAWVAGQDSPDAIVACDPAMCAALEAHGVPAGRLLALTPARSDPLGSDLVVATAAVRGQFGARLVGVYAPVTLASFGSGTARIDVRVVAPDGAAAYWTALAADVRARASAGAQLLRNRSIHVSAAARTALANGEVDPRLLVDAGRAGPPAPAGHHRLRRSQPGCQRRRAAALRRDHRGRAAGLAPPGVTAQPDGGHASPARALRALITRDSPDPARRGCAQDRIPGPEPARAAEIRRLTQRRYR